MRITAWRSKLITLVLLAVLIGALYLFGPGCPILRLTGIPCPGCGMTRALLAALRGDFVGAMRWHGMVWSLPLLLAIFLWDGKLFPARWANAALMILLAAGFLVNWIGRLMGAF